MYRSDFLAFNLICELHVTKRYIMRYIMFLWKRETLDNNACLTLWFESSSEL